MIMMLMITVDLKLDFNRRKMMLLCAQTRVYVWKIIRNTIITSILMVAMMIKMMMIAILMVII